MNQNDYWGILESMIDQNGYVIDRKKGTSHPRYPNFVYPVDYGYIDNTQSMDNNEIDLFAGSLEHVGVNGIICTIDVLKNDSEIKVCYRCSLDEIKAIMEVLDKSRYMKAIYIARESGLHD